jgi:hypothetical protein
MNLLRKLMKVVPAIPGHFTVYEWLALGVWIALGAISHRRKIGTLIDVLLVFRADVLRELCVDSET